ncbi:hypothetical protein QA600_12795 [Natronococcus sp. A-GB1]|uniref:hypothetical protein n=1 Tax=Natronococcus sp. A-GB1 TaxID=3037648 RepID=UPI00241D983D|nr:hypothetical protein [Natronococcus sp. A-GB1]MDG5760214.1 hypothetical protein [Natronococcus sp. A-GB1]
MGDPSVAFSVPRTAEGSSSVGVFYGALVATVFVYNAMFRNPSLPTAQPKRAAAAIVWHAFLFVLALTGSFG